MSVREPVEGARDKALREQLRERRERLETAASRTPGDAELKGLLDEVDAALLRVDRGEYGLCEVCHDPVEESRILADPLVRFCLDHLTPAEQRALEHDLELASRIQVGLLPRKDLVFGGWEMRYHYEPAHLVSGDYCDLFLPPGEKGDLVFLFGDVSGKGVSASILMAHLQAIFRSLLASGLSLDGLLERGNRVFCQSTLSTYYATLVCGRATSVGEVEIGNAGHCPPLVVRGGEVTPLEATGLPVGLFSSGRYGLKRVRLLPEDLLVLYTDGLTEATNPSGQEYGSERLARVLSECWGKPPEKVIENCLFDLRGFRGSAPRGDDLTLMVLRRRPD